jgi:transposase InsO family protein
METSPVDQRERFIRDHRLELYAMAELCARYGISRKTGYKWLARFDEGGRLGLRDRSRAPHHCPHRIARDVAAVICAARRQHPSWGPARLLAWLRPRHVSIAWPAVSTAGDLLARRGLVKKRRRRRQWQHPGVVPALTSQPNDLWTTDFKGHFRTRDAIYCYPLTVADQHTRYLLACHGLLSTKGQGVRPIFDRLFREYGLPRAIRTDNGVPFATTGIHGLSQLNVWWLRRAFNAFRRLDNDERPHEALGDRPPATLCRPSTRPYTGTLPPVEYPGHFLVKRVTNAGTIRLKKRLLFVSNALKQHPVGLEEVDDGIWSIHFCHVLLGRVDERDYVIRP